MSGSSHAVPGPRARGGGRARGGAETVQYRTRAPSLGEAWPKHLDILKIEAKFP